MIRIATIRRAAATVVLAAAHLATPAAAEAQTTITIHACYVPSTGAVYRIKTPDTPQACTKTTHVPFSWVDGANAIKIPYSTTVNSANNLFSLNNPGSGLAAQFLAGANTGAYGRSMTGAGLHGATFSTNPTSGAGVRAEAVLAGGTALEVKGGAIRVTGAGMDTKTAVFRTWLGCEARYLDHPMLNGDANAMVFVQPIEGRFDNAAIVAYVEYDTGAGKWKLKSNNKLDTGFGASICYTPIVNVMIVKG